MVIIIIIMINFKTSSSEVKTSSWCHFASRILFLKSPYLLELQVPILALASWYAIQF